MAKRVLLLSGPNLNLLGEREPAIYGSASLDDYVSASERRAKEHGLELDHFQSNHEGELVDAVHRARGDYDAIVINAGALTHYGWSLHDALSAYGGKIVEVHISNPFAREAWRHTSVITPVADGSICGLGAIGYDLAIDAVARMLDT